MEKIANDNLERIFKATLTDKDFEKLSYFIYNEYGIKMPPAKKIMLQSRLQKRLRDLNISNFSDYVKYVFSHKGQSEEVIHMMDVVSTNKTDFFREPVHFDFLVEHILPSLIKNRLSSNKIKIWSAGCSSGEEPYTIAIVLNEYKLRNPGWDFEIFGSDISTRMLQHAANGIYKEERISNIPLSIKKKYFLKSKDKEKQKVRVISELRQKIKFFRLNFMDTNYPIYENFDLIFCRNVLIYFDRTTQEQVINKLCTKLKPSGYFFLGHSESITNFRVPITQIKPTIFIKQNS